MKATEYFEYNLLETKQWEEWLDSSGSEGDGAVSSASIGVCWGWVSIAVAKYIYFVHVAPNCN